MNKTEAYICIKCGFPYHKTRFCPNTSNCRCHFRREETEHLEITCCNCGFTWAEETKDNFA